MVMDSAMLTMKDIVEKWDSIWNLPDVGYIKAGSQSDARPCIVLFCETHKFITKKVRSFLMTRRKNTMQGNARIGSESILASCCISTSIDEKTMQRNALFSIVLWTGLYILHVHNSSYCYDDNIVHIIILSIIEELEKGPFSIF